MLMYNLWSCFLSPQHMTGSRTELTFKIFCDEQKFEQKSLPPPGIQTSEDARFYALSKKFSPFSNKGKDLVVQFTVKHEQNIDCGGGYVKVFDCSLDQKNMHGESPYLLMFGTYFISYLKKKNIIH